jgi:hypothetical protein
MHLGFGARVIGDPPMHARCARAAEAAAGAPSAGSSVAQPGTGRTDKPS